MVKLMYICHQVSGDVAQNIRQILAISRRLHTADTIAMAPYLVFLQYLDEARPEERALGLMGNKELLRKGVFDEIGVFGPRISQGMYAEIKLGHELRMPIVAYDGRVEADLRHCIKGLEMGIAFMPYVRAQRRLPNGYHLFFMERTDQNRDLIGVRVKPFIDGASRKDVSIWRPGVIDYDEVECGWETLDLMVANSHPSEKTAIRERVYGRLAADYGRRPMGRVFEEMRSGILN